MRHEIQENAAPNAARLSMHCRTGAALLFALLVFFGTLPGAAIALSTVLPDKVLHFLAYGLLSALLYYAMPALGPGMRVLATWFSIGLLGALDEAAQSFMPYRNAYLRDWLCNMAASLSCITLLASINARPFRKAN